MAFQHPLVNDDIPDLIQGKRIETYSDDGQYRTVFSGGMILIEKWDGSINPDTGEKFGWQAVFYNTADWLNIDRLQINKEALFTMGLTAGASDITNLPRGMDSGQVVVDLAGPGRAASGAYVNRQIVFRTEFPVRPYVILTPVLDTNKLTLNVRLHTTGNRTSQYLSVVATSGTLPTAGTIPVNWLAVLPQSSELIYIK